jgi:acyl-CoA thioester hydrolase
MRFTDMSKTFPRAPFEGRIQSVESQWTDYNGHLNMAYYHVLLDRAADECFEEFGLGPDYVKRAGSSYFTLEAHVTYLRELHAGDPVRITTLILDCDARRVHYAQEMFHARDGYRACVGENMVMHVDMKARRSSPFPEEVFASIAAMREAHQGLPVPREVGHRIGIPRKG